MSPPPVRRPGGRKAPILAVLGILLLGGCAAEQQDPKLPPTERQRHQQAMRRAVEWFWSHQAQDGGWHSQDYGLLRSGHSLTPLVLWTLLQVPDHLVRRGDRRLGKAANFIRNNLGKAGGLGILDIPDYPNYASGLALRAMVRLGNQHDVLGRLQSYLLGQQYGPDLGYRPEDPAFGGWGMGGEPRKAAAGPGHMDLSMTRVVLQGLAAHPPADPEVFRRARRFLARCQNPDGGFYFSPVVLGANKGDREGERFGSYGSTTADGILAMLATGMQPEDDKVRAARDLLVQKHRTDLVPGIPTDVPNNWAVGLRFYYLAVSSEVFQRLGVEQAPPGKDWRKVLLASLLPEQRQDGSWSNKEGQVKEDDPIIATALALCALAHAWN